MTTFGSGPEIGESALRGTFKPVRKMWPSCAGTERKVGVQA